jgi:hypothetical protein
MKPAAEEGTAFVPWHRTDLDEILCSSHHYGKQLQANPFATFHAFHNQYSVDNSFAVKPGSSIY